MKEKTPSHPATMYAPPSLEVVEISIENGFAGSVPGIGFGQNDYSDDDL